MIDGSYRGAPSRRAGFIRWTPRAGGYDRLRGRAFAHRTPKIGFSTT